jgi:hypothetical protein
MIEVPVRPFYPVNPAELPTYWGNLIAVVTTNEEVYLDVCQVQPQTMKDPSGNPASAMAVVRVVISKAHAERLVRGLNRALAQVSEAESASPHK